MEKKCTKCGEVKALGEFYKAKAYKDGHTGDCKSCCKEYSKHYREDNKDRISGRRVEYFKNYYQDNKEQYTHLSIKATI